MQAITPSAHWSHSCCNRANCMPLARPPALQATAQSAAAAAEAEAQAMTSQNAALQDEVSRLRQSLQAASAAAGSAAKPKGGWLGRGARGAAVGSDCLDWLTRQLAVPVERPWHCAIQRVNSEATASRWLALD